MSFFCFQKLFLDCIFCVMTTPTSFDFRIKFKNDLFCFRNNNKLLFIGLHVECFSIIWIASPKGYLGYKFKVNNLSFEKQHLTN